MLAHVHILALQYVLQEQQVRQEQEIGMLERQLEEAKFRHENHVRSMKTQFLQEKRAYDAKMAARVRTMTQRASQVNTMEPLNNGHEGDRPLVCCREVVPISEVIP